MKKSVLGLFFAKDPQALKAFAQAQYRVIGPHALSAQRMHADAGAAACIWGRLRSAKQMRRDLEKEGVRISPDADEAELILAGYRAWGEGLALRMEGPASAAVIDCDAKRLLLIRDRMGEAPVFYARSCGGVAFADRPLPLLGAPGVSRIVDRDGVCELFALGPARTPGRTPLRDIMELESGCVLIAQENSLNVRRYFSLDAAEHEDDEKTTVERTRYLLEQAVAESIALQPSCMISGGLDSSIISSVAASYMKKRGERLTTFSVTYRDNDKYFKKSRFQPNSDEMYIDIMQKYLDSNHHMIVIDTPELADALKKAYAATESFEFANKYMRKDIGQRALNILKG